MDGAGSLSPLVPMATNPSVLRSVFFKHNLNIRGGGLQNRTHLKEITLLRVIFFLLALQPPLGVVFYSPLAGFSLLAYEVS